ncbi:AAA family ATPase [Scytonema sp. PRP1]|uniref:AAA family ATPase n=1 Tax=Scytonema sp. PRP1 TaxID=3120513 RepID=UPI002FD77711
MLRYQAYRDLLEKINRGVNINLWGRTGIGKTYLIKQALLKDTSCKSLYLALDYPFNVDSLFSAIAMGFGLYAGAEWQQIVERLQLGENKLLVLDNFDRLHCTTNDLSADLSRLQMLAILDTLSLLTVSCQPLRYFHFQSFTDCFQELEMNESNSHIF